MDGPKILARSMSTPRVSDEYGNSWQYHSRSDQHSKVACWAMLFDLLRHCPLLRQHITERKVGFGINHEMRDFTNNRKKNLDLVICTPGSERRAKGKKAKEPQTFASLSDQYHIELLLEERTWLAKLPELPRVGVGSVHIALEAKAAMTAHIKALPRLFDELNSSHLAIHGASDYAIAAGFAIVNYAATFISPDRNRKDLTKEAAKVSVHKQPNDTARAIAKLEEIPRRTTSGAAGFDALGIVVLELKNDGTPVRIVTHAPAPTASDVWHYNQMIDRMASLYANKFGNV